MPELPEVETMVRGIRPILEGFRLNGFSACPCLCRPLLVSPSVEEIRSRAEGRIVTRVMRRAKRILIELAGEETFVIEPRMTGLMLIGDPPDEAHLRYRWTVRDGRRNRHVWFWDRRGLGTIRLCTQAEIEERLGPKVLGPDVLVMSIEDWMAALGRTDRAVKVALLDQRLFAGIGNLYASEILHRARIHPTTVCSRLSRSRIARLRAAAAEILEDAILNEGSTLSDGTYRNVLNRAGGYRSRHRVYDREGEACPTCGRGAVRRIVQSQRSTFYCSVCQR